MNRPQVAAHAARAAHAVRAVLVVRAARLLGEAGRPPELSAYLQGRMHVGTSGRLPNVIERGQG
ncbi:MAG TPA: hypothetical protein VFZ85_17870 [Jiangellaceae bacterium]